MDKVQVNGIDWQLKMMQSLVQDSFLGSPIKFGNPVLQHLLHNRLQMQEAVYTLPPMYAMLCNVTGSNHDMHAKTLQKLCVHDIADHV